MLESSNRAKPQWTQPDPINRPNLWERDVSPEILAKMPKGDRTIVDMGVGFELRTAIHNLLTFFKNRK